MFSANENLQLRQHKRRIVGFIEECIPEDALDQGVSVMVMQVSCKAPGCVPLETAIVIIFPACDEELLPGLPESRGGNFKTKVLKPMSQVTQQDVLESLPPEFPGGLRSVEKLCIQARDVMLAQITQLFGEEDEEGRKLMAQYLQQSLQDYMDRACTPPELGEAFGPIPQGKKTEAIDTTEAKSGKDSGESSKVSSSSPIDADAFKGTKNIVIRRVLDKPDDPVPSSKRTAVVPKPSSSTLSHSRLPTPVTSITKLRQQQAAERQLNQQLAGGDNPLARLTQRAHSPAVRPRGCPCCDPDNPSNVVDELLHQQIPTNIVILV